MIFTECKCGELITIGWESGMKHGYYRTNCAKCGRIAMTECTSFGGETHILENERELEKFIADKKLKKSLS